MSKQTTYQSRRTGNGDHCVYRGDLVVADLSSAGTLPVQMTPDPFHHMRMKPEQNTLLLRSGLSNMVQKMTSLRTPGYASIQPEILASALIIIFQLQQTGPGLKFSIPWNSREWWEQEIYICCITSRFALGIPHWLTNKVTHLEER